MGVVTVTGNAWDHANSPIPAGRHPELWFRPNRAKLAGDALLTATDVRASLDAVSGAFSVQLESGPGVLYRPWMRWLVNPGETDPERWAFGYEEWPFEINPYPFGGPISELVRVELSIYTVYVGLADPPPGYRGWWLHAAPGDPNNVLESGTGELRSVFG